MPSAGKCSPEEKKTGIPIPSSSVSLAASSWRSSSIPSSERHHGKNDSKNNTNALSLNSLSSKHEGGKIRPSRHSQTATKKRLRDDNDDVDDKGSFSFDSDDNEEEGSLNLGNKIPSNNVWNNQETSRRSGNNTATSLSLVHKTTVVAPFPIALPSNASWYPALPSASLPSASLPSASLPSASLRPAQSFLERNRKTRFVPSTKRIEGRKSDRTPTAAAFDRDKKERTNFSSLVLSAHSLVEPYTSVSLVGPFVDPRWLQGADDGKDGWNSMSTGQLRAERAQAHKRTPRMDLTSDTKYAMVAGWIDRYNKSSGSDFAMFGISDEEIVAGAEKGVCCNTCDYVLPSSVGLPKDFMKKVSLKDDERASNHPLRYHHGRCGAKCDHCGITMEDYLLEKGSDRGWTRHVGGHCKDWHESLKGLIELEKKYGTWKIKRDDKRLTSEETVIMGWVKTQRNKSRIKNMTEYQKKKLASTFTGW